MGPLPHSLPSPGAEPFQKSAAAVVQDAAVAPLRDPSTDFESVDRLHVARLSPCEADACIIS